MEAATYLNPNYETFIRKMELNHFYRSFVPTAVQLVILLIGRCGGGLMDLGGSYELDFQEFSPCEVDPSPYFNYTTKTVPNENGTKFLEGFLSMTKVLGDSQNVVADAYRWGQNAGYQSIYHLDKPKACSYLKENFPGVFNKFTEMIGSGDTCPVKKGEYQLSGMRLNGWTLENLKRLPYGTFKVKVMIKDGNSVDGCITIKLDINQKA